MSTTTVRSPYNRRAAKLMRQREWHFAHGTVRRRIYDLTVCRDPWWSWGNRLMTVTGTEFGGSWSEPSPPTWWYRPDTTKRMWRTNYPVQRFHVVRTYDDYMSENNGVDHDSDEHAPWKAIGVNQDHELHLGRQYWGQGFYGLGVAEMRLLVRWLIRWEVTNWFGARLWLYKLGLHAAVFERKPWSCGDQAPRPGGYSHWTCQEKRNHDGPHRFRQARWDDTGLLAAVEAGF